MSLLEDVKRAFAGRYLVNAEVGEGGSARVFAAHDIKHDRRVAIKILKQEVVESIAAGRFLREIRVDASLQHPRILPLFDSGEVLGMPYFVMPFIEGATLRQRLQRDVTLPVSDALRITTQIAEALQYLHGRGLVHRDIKPENILLQDEHVWLADFGIVRALQEAVTGRRTVTDTGTAVGTPAYMSPEQRLGSPTVDGRSDQFSLACVLYEMLVGHPPKAFERRVVSATPNSPRITPTSALRNGVSSKLDHVLARALELNEDDRWPSMQVFAEQLVAAVTPLSSGVVSGAARVFPRRASALLAVVVIAVATAWYALGPGTPALDALTVAVLPLAHEGDSTGALLDGDDCSRFLRDAIGRWTGIHHVDDMQLRDVRVRMGRPETLSDAMKMARRLNAGMAVWGTVGPMSPTTGNSARQVRLILYDVASGASRQEANGVVDARHNISDVFQSLADSLVAGIAGPSPSRVSGSHNLLAVRAYLDGHRALDRFDLGDASAAFRRAVDVDPTYGMAFLWLAWSTMWLPESNSRDWGAAAARALAVGSGLDGRDSVHARALVEMNARHFAEACDLLRSLTTSDPRDFAAWYGLGECLSSDYAVVPDAASPSRWRFRTSLREAMTAYEKAIELVPSFNDAMGQRAMQRISYWLFAETGRYRGGLGPDSQRFAAWPSLSADTLAFVPFAERAVFAESAGTRQGSYADALQQNRARVLALVTRWVGLDSNNVLALESLALAREANEELLALRRPEAGANLTGINAIRRARQLSTGESAVRLGAIEVRFLIKADRYAQARQLADSLLARADVSTASPATASWLYGLAMLTGKVPMATRWGRQATAFQYTDPMNPDASVTPALSAAASDAAVFASIGAPVDSIRAALARTEQAIARQRDPGGDVLHQLYVEQPVLYAWPRLGVAAAPAWRPSAGNRWLAVQRALAASDSGNARRMMLQGDSSAMRGGIGQMAFEIALVNAHIWLAMSDTANATRAVHNAVTLVSNSGEQLVKRPTATAAYVRLLVLRAALADAAHDTIQARALATRAWTLWRDADVMLAPEMRPILRWRSEPIPGGVK